MFLVYVKEYTHVYLVSKYLKEIFQNFYKKTQNVLFAFYWKSFFAEFNLHVRMY